MSMPFSFSISSALESRSRWRPFVCHCLVKSSEDFSFWVQQKSSQIGNCRVWSSYGDHQGEHHWQGHHMQRYSIPCSRLDYILSNQFQVPQKKRSFNWEFTCLSFWPNSFLVLWIGFFVRFSGCTLLSISYLIRTVIVFVFTVSIDLEFEMLFVFVVKLLWRGNRKASSLYRMCK